LSGETATVGGIQGGIGDDVCAVMLKFDLSVVDPAGQPIQEAELWEVDRVYLRGKAFRLGATDGNGHLEALDCYMGSLEFRFWHPTEEPLQLNLMVLRDGFGIQRLRLSPPVRDVLEAGNVLGVPPGEPFEWSQIKVDPTRHERSFKITTRVTLAPATRQEAK
jgi:hypothetical protein